MRQEAEEETHGPTEQKWSQSQMRIQHICKMALQINGQLLANKLQVMANNLVTLRFEIKKLSHDLRI